MFAPLRIISGYTFLQSGLTIERIAQSIKKENYFGAGLSDSGVLFGFPSFVHELEKINKPFLLGMEVYHHDHYFVLYAYNEEGYRNLIKISLEISKNIFEFDFLVKHHSGLYGILETNYGYFKNEFKENNDDSFIKEIAHLSNLCDKFFLGLEINNRDEFNYSKLIRKFAQEYCYDTIAFPRVKYQNKKDAIVLRIANAINSDEKLDIQEEEGEEYFHPLEFYSKIYTPKEIDLTEELIKSSTFNFHQKRGEIISFPVDDSVKTLKENVFKGLKEKGIDDEKHIERANYELDVITSMGYSDYFLIVSDYVNYSKNNHILVGPGRGSAAGSLVSYALNITEVDPFDFDLQFERFLNKARKSMPDIDVDFQDTKREEVISYMREKYGYNHIANIVTFQTIQAKQALRDIGRIYNIPTRHIDLLSKSIPDNKSDNEKITLRSAYKKFPTFKNLVDSDKYFLNIVSMASKIEGLPRQNGLHAAGIVLNKLPIDDVLPVISDFDDSYTTQYEKDYLEEQGFLKMDFLSLTNLSTIDLCLSLIKENTGKEISFYDIPYQDKNIFDLIRSGQTIGVFQLESSGMRNAIKIIEPKEFADIVTLLAIFRPGPMDNIRDYADKKNGKIKITYLSEELKEILSPTYGIIIYQEQINKIAQVMAGFSPEEADLFRRAVSHKEKDVLISSQKDFINGAIKKGYSKENAKTMFDQILKFANYGFNKSHAVVYAIIACRMAYLKYHYPLEFYSAILTISSGTTDHKFSDYVAEIKKRNYQVYLPDINKSDKLFIIHDKGLLFPLNNIKGVSEAIVNKIIDERIENGVYKDFFDFVSRSYKKGISESTTLKLIDAGAFDSLYPSRATLRSTTKYAYQLAELSYDKNGQLILDATLDSQKQYFKDNDDPLTNLNLENDALGIMLSSNPLRYMKDLLISNHAVSLNEVSEKYGTINVAGIISSIKTIKVKKNNSTMAFVKLFDESGELEVTVFPKTYEEYYKLLTKNNIVLISGRYEHKQDKESFIADSIKLLEE